MIRALVSSLRSRGRRHSSRPDALPLKLAGQTGVLLATVVALAGCGGSDTERYGQASEAADLVHIHGLGINPANGALMIATHAGLYRVAAKSNVATRLSDRRQDTMGFAVAGPDDYFGSGHPDLRDDLPPLLGLIRSSDGGRTWKPVSLLGKADFHVLRLAGDRIYGFDASNDRLMVSDDDGTSWRQRGPAQFRLRDLAVDPANSDRLVVTTEDGTLGSDDGGKSWARRSTGTGLLAWAESDRLYLVANDGSIWTSPDGGREWRQTGSVKDEPAVVQAIGPLELYVAFHDGAIHLTRDGGRTWSLRFRP